MTLLSEACLSLCLYLMSFEINSVKECRALETRGEGRKIFKGTVRYKKTKIVGTRTVKKFSGYVQRCSQYTNVCQMDGQKNKRITC